MYILYKINNSIGNNGNHNNESPRWTDEYNSGHNIKYFLRILIWLYNIYI